MVKTLSKVVCSFVCVCMFTEVDGCLVSNGGCHKYADCIRTGPNTVRHSVYVRFMSCSKPTRCANSFLPLSGNLKIPAQVLCVQGRLSFSLNSVCKCGSDVRRIFMFLIIPLFFFIASPSSPDHHPDSLSLHIIQPLPLPFPPSSLDPLLVGYSCFYPSSLSPAAHPVL